jgi:hypothetical protein
MNARDFLVSSPIPWFAEHADEVINAIVTESGITPDMFRRNQIYDATVRRRVPTAAQRLIRWSYSGPEEVFVSGFMPRIIPYQHDGDGAFPPAACNLRSYVAENSPSIFVGTTQPYRANTRRIGCWEPRVTPDNQRRYRYEIFAYGGIVVNRVLHHHGHQNQHEIAFPGGIRPEMVRHSREYQGTGDSPSLPKPPL